MEGEKDLIFSIDCSQIYKSLLITLVVVAIFNVRLFVSFLIVLVVLVVSIYITIYISKKYDEFQRAVDRSQKYSSLFDEVDQERPESQG